MKAKLKNRIKGKNFKGRAFIRLLDETGYLILSFAALWASAMSDCFTGQFLILSVILGLKWVFGNKVQVIQIFYPERKELI